MLAHTESNLLDAILFGLGMPADVLRVRSWSELTHKSRAGPCAVRLTVSTAHTGVEQPQLAVLAHVRESDGTRSFKLDGALATGPKVKEALLALGLDTSTPSFAVRQHAAARTLDSTALTALLQQASGASQWQAAATISHGALARERQQLEKVNADVGALEALLAREREAQRSLRTQLALQRRGRQGNATLRELAQNLLRLYQRIQEGARAQVRERAATSQRTAGELRQSEDEVKQRIQTARARAENDTMEVSAAIRALGTCTDACQDSEDAVLHAAVLCQLAAVERERLRAESQQLERDGESRKQEAARRRGQLKASRQAVVEAQAAVAESDAALSKWSAAASTGWLVDRILNSARTAVTARLSHEEQIVSDSRAAELDAQQHLKRLQSLRVERTQALAEARASLAEQTETRRVAQRRVAEGKAVTAQAREYACSMGVLYDDAMCSAPCETTDAALHLEKAICMADTARAQAVERHRRSARTLAKYDPTLDASMPTARSGAEENHAPTLLSILKLRDADARLERSLLALQVIAGKHLGVRLTATPDAALPLLQDARRQGVGVRVWPLSTIQTR